MNYRIDNAPRVRTAFERNARALAKRPSIGRGTATTTVRVTDGLTCEIEEGRWRFPCDMSEKRGGTDAGIFPVVDARVSTEVCPLFFHLGTGVALATLFADAGYEVITSDRISIVLRYASAEATCGAAFAGGPVAMAYARFDEATRAEAHADYLDTIAPYGDSNGYAIPGGFVVVRADKPYLPC